MSWRLGIVVLLILFLVGVNYWNGVHPDHVAQFAKEEEHDIHGS
jgi:hypothetical protein